MWPRICTRVSDSIFVLFCERVQESLANGQKMHTKKRQKKHIRNKRSQRQTARCDFPMPPQRERRVTFCGGFCCLLPIKRTPCNMMFFPSWRFEFKKMYQRGEKKINETRMARTGHVNKRVNVTQTSFIAFLTFVIVTAASRLRESKNEKRDVRLCGSSGVANVTTFRWLSFNSVLVCDFHSHFSYVMIIARQKQLAKSYNMLNPKCILCSSERMRLSLIH